MSKRFVEDEEKDQAYGQLHVDVYCSKCGSDMIELEFNRKDSGDGYVWECFHKCPKCGAKVEWRR